MAPVSHHVGVRREFSTGYLGIFAPALTTNLSVNPARSTGPAVFVGGWAIEQLWLFWIAPVAGAILAGLVYPTLAEEPNQK